VSCWRKQLAGLAFWPGPGGLCMAAGHGRAGPMVWMERVLEWCHALFQLTWWSGIQLFYSPWAMAFPNPVLNDGMSFALGWSHLLLALVVCVWVEWRGKPGMPFVCALFAAACGALCLLTLQDAPVDLGQHSPLCSS